MLLRKHYNILCQLCVKFSIGDTRGNDRLRHNRVVIWWWLRLSVNRSESHITHGELYHSIRNRLSELLELSKYHPLVFQNSFLLTMATLANTNLGVTQSTVSCAYCSTVQYNRIWRRLLTIILLYCEWMGPYLPLIHYSVTVHSSPHFAEYITWQHVSVRINCEHSLDSEEPVNSMWFDERTPWQMTLLDIKLLMITCFSIVPVGGFLGGEVSNAVTFESSWGPAVWSSLCACEGFLWVLWLRPVVQRQTDKVNCRV